MTILTENKFYGIKRGEVHSIYGTQKHQENMSVQCKKMGFKGYTYFSYFLLQNIDCGYTLVCTHNLCFEQKIRKISNNFYRKFSFFFYKFKNLCILAWAYFRNGLLFFSLLALLVNLLAIAFRIPLSLRTRGQSYVVC